jgi:RHS repeat-associated protein
VYETNGTYAILFTYDYDGTLISFNYDANVLDAVNGPEYFYIRNQQGDITHLVDSTGVVSVHYLYDGYGTITYQTPSQSIGEMNPYRYRGYRYDEELSWYYLNSRYYSAATGRFLNSDGLLGEFGSILSTNMYAYCVNNPVMNFDPSGESIVGIVLFTLFVYAVYEIGVKILELVFQEDLKDMIPSVRLPERIDVDNEIMLRIYYDQMARNYVERRFVNVSGMFDTTLLAANIYLSDIPIIGDIGAAFIENEINRIQERIFSNPTAMREEYRLASYNVIGSGDYFDYFQERVYHWRDVYDLR